jgi:hypothetical protein
VSKIVNLTPSVIELQLRPSPKWKLVVDVGVGPPTKSDEMTEEEAILLRELLALVQKCMPADKNSEFASFLPGFTSLRLLLSQQTRSIREEDLLESILAMYASYKKSGQLTESNIAVLTARDFMLLSKHEKCAKIHHPSGKSVPSREEGRENEFMNRVPATASEFGSQLDDVHINAPQYPILNSKVNRQDYTGLTLGVSPALHPIVGSPTLDSHGQFASLANSPTLQPISSQVAVAPELAPFEMTASPISDMLRNDRTNFREM